MEFTYSVLAQAARNKERLGSWKGKGVYAVSRADLSSLGGGVFYVVYDDGNKLVTRDGSRWMSYGTLDKQGTVHETNRPTVYSLVEEKKVGTPKAAQSAWETVQEVAKAVVETRKAESPVGDVKAELDVEAWLKKARTMTVSDLLEGFDYGL